MFQSSKTRESEWNEWNRWNGWNKTLDRRNSTQPKNTPKF